MNIINATPPADFPDQVIVLDREFAKLRPASGFYLRVAEGREKQVNEAIRLEGVVTLVEARRMATVHGYAPTHWIETTSGTPTAF